jgi:phospholipid transport system substrate-binding protein
MRCLLFTLLLAFASPNAESAPEAPEPMVRRALQDLSGIVATCRFQLAADPLALRGLVDQHIRPALDILYAGQLILGRSWAEAEPEQRRRFAEALYGSLNNRYASGLLLLTSQNVRVAAAEAPPDNGEASVELLVSTQLAAPLPVRLQMRRSGDRWRAFDARWEGQSYVLSLRQAVAEQVRRDGLEAVIQRLEASAGVPAGPPAERQTAAGRCLRGLSAS